MDRDIDRVDIWDRGTSEVGSDGKTFAKRLASGDWPGNQEDSPCRRRLAEYWHAAITVENVPKFLMNQRQPVHEQAYLEGCMVR